MWVVGGGNPPLLHDALTFSLPPDPHLGLGVLRGGAGGGIQQTQEPLPQPDARRRRHSDRALPAAQDRHGGESQAQRKPHNHTGADLSWFERSAY